MPNNAIISGVRPNAPDTWTRARITREMAHEMELCPTTTINMISYPVTWHHNTPWEKLRDSWNVIAAFCSDTILQQTISFYYAGHGADESGASSLYTSIKALREAVGLTRRNASTKTYAQWVAEFAVQVAQGHGISNDEYDALRTTVAWQRWNIVEGPKESVRTDDPGSTGFDDFAKCDPNRGARYRAAKAMYDALDKLRTEYTAASGNACNLDGPPAAWNKLMQQTLQSASNLRHQTYVPFTRAMWKQVTRGSTIERITQDGVVLYRMKRNEK